MDSSLIYFGKAFFEVKHPFSRHVYNAALVGAKLKKYTTVLEYINYLLRLGANLKIIKNERSFNHFFETKLGKSVSLNYHKTKPIYDPSYRKEIEQLISNDQRYRKLTGSYRLYGDSIRNIDRKNITTLLRLVKEKGFPSESKIGVDSEGFLNPLYIVIVIHQSSGGQQLYDFSTLIKENIINGNIENKAGEYMINRCSGFNFFQIVKLQYVKGIDSIMAMDPTASLANRHNIIVLDSTDWGYFPLSEKEEFTTTQRRSELYLDSYEESLKKVLFSLKNPEYLLNNTGSKSFLNYKDYSEYIKVKNNIRFY